MPDPAVLEDFLNLLAGHQIGRSGMSRKVFELVLSPEYVVKIEEGEYMFQNVVENEYWNQVEWTEYKKWFAPVRAISPNGRVLIMAKTEPAPKSAYPKMMPAFFSDFKYSNYGLYKGRIVCHDYGTCLLPTVGLTKKMKKADWID